MVRSLTLSGEIDRERGCPRLVCEACGARVAELRRGRCWGCYERWVESRPVGLGAVCCVCGERRREFLTQVELKQAWVAMCHACAARAMQLSPMPAAIEEIRRSLARNRRVAERRVGRTDTRVFPRERRGPERREVGRARDGEVLPIDDEDIILVMDDGEPGEETRILDRGEARSAS